MKEFVVYLLIGSILMTSGCSAFRPSTQTVVIQPTDPSAEVFVDGQSYGTGTVTADLKRNKSHAVLARSGDRAGAAAIDTKISGTGVLDIVGTFLIIVPAIGLFSPGFWDLDQTHVNVVVPPQPVAVQPVPVQATVAPQQPPH